MRKEQYSIANIHFNLRSAQRKKRRGFHSIFLQEQISWTLGRTELQKNLYIWSYDTFPIVIDQRAPMFSEHWKDPTSRRCWYWLGVWNLCSSHRKDASVILGISLKSLSEGWAGWVVVSDPSKLWKMNDDHAGRVRITTAYLGAPINISNLAQNTSWQDDVQCWPGLGKNQFHHPVITSIAIDFATVRSNVWDRH